MINRDCTRSNFFFHLVEPDKIQTSFYNEEGFRCATWSSSGLSPSLRLVEY